MNRRMFQILGGLLIAVLGAFAIVMVNLDETETAFGLFASAAFTLFLVFFFARQLDA